MLRRIPSFLLAKERVVERSNDRVSRLYERHYRKCITTSLLTPTTLRWSTLSSVNGKEGEEIDFFVSITVSTYCVVG